MDAIAINLISSIIWVPLGIFLNKIIEYLCTKKEKKFWSKFSKEPILMIAGQIPTSSSNNKLGVVPVVDSLAMMEIKTYFEVLGIKGLKIDFPNTIAGDMLKSNLILVGGPAVNTVSADAIDLLKSQINFRFNDFGTIVDKKSSEITKPKYDLDTNLLKTDTAIILRTKNPFNPNKNLIMIAGSVGYATWAGARFITSKDYWDNSEIKDSSTSECVIETNITRHTPQKITLLKCLSR